MAAKASLTNRPKGMRNRLAPDPEPEPDVAPDTTAFGERAKRRKERLTKRGGNDLRVTSAAKKVAAAKNRVNSVMTDKEYN